MMKMPKTSAVCILIAFVAAICPSTAAAQEVGPTNGSLVIVGGGLTPGIVQRFIELAGGADAKIVVIPTAMGGDNAAASGQGFARRLTGYGAKNVTVLHTRDREKANSDSFVQPLTEAGGVWFGGGRQWRLADAYLGTKTEQALRGVLDRGGVIGGSSAGATIQGSYLVRGDSKTNVIMMGDHEQGFGYLKNTAIDQHVLTRNRQFDMIEVIRAKPELLGIGLDDDTAIVVQGDEFEVIGRSYVAIYDHETMGAEGRFYFLAPGQRFDLATRTVKRTARGGRGEPLERSIGR
ncbi:MAG: cyanophycinase [Phycisphaerales bacterium]